MQRNGEISRLLCLLLSAALFPCIHSFLCTKADVLFSHPDSCQQYFKCISYRGYFYLESIYCSPETFFDDIHSECLPKNRVTSPPQCVVNDTKDVKDVGDIITDDVEYAGTNITEDVMDVADILTDDVEYAGTIATEDVKDVGVIITEDVKDVGDITEDVKDVGDIITEDVKDVGDITYDVEYAGNYTTDRSEMYNETLEMQPDYLAPEELDTTRNVTEVSDDLVDVSKDINEAVIDYTKEEFTTITQSKTCDDVKSVDDHATLLISSPEFKESREYQVVFNSLIGKYNLDLKNARTFTYIWRRGDESLLHILKNLFRKVSMFKVEFDQKLKVYKQQVKGINVQVTGENADQTAIQEQTEAKRILEEEIEQTKQVLESTAVAAVRRYFENVIAQKQQELELMDSEKDPNSMASQHLAELMYFLEDASSVSIELKNLSSHWQESVDSVLKKLQNERDIFRKHVKRINEDVLDFSASNMNLKEEQTINIKEQVRLDNLKKTIDKNLSVSNDRNAEITTKIYDVANAIADKVEAYNSEKTYICSMNDENSESSYLTDRRKEIACKLRLKKHNVSLDIWREKAQLEKLKQQRKRISTQIGIYLDNLNSITQKLRHLWEEESTFDPRSTMIANELRNTLMLRSDVEKLAASANTVIKSFGDIRVEVIRLQVFITSVTSNIDELIIIGNTAGTNDDKLRKIENIETHLDFTNQQLKDLKVTDMQACKV